MKYDRKQLKDIKEDKLVIYWVDKENQRLVPLENIKVDKKNQTVSGTTTHFSTFILGSEMPINLSMVDVVFTVDQSLSMDTTDPEYKRLDVIKRFLQYYEPGNDDDPKPTGIPEDENVRMGLVEFSDFAYTKQALTNQQTGLADILSDKSQTIGATSLADAIWVTRQQYVYDENNPDSARRRISLLITDADDTMGNASPHLISILEGLEEQDCNIVFNTIYLGDMDNDLLMDMAEKTGGAYFRLDPSLNEEDIKSQIELIYEKIGKQITLDKITAPPEEFTNQLRAALDMYGLRGRDYDFAERLYTLANTNMLTGNYYREDTDLKIMNYNGPEFMFRRMYNTDAGSEKTTIGNGWRHNYDTYIKEIIKIGRVNISGLNFREEPSFEDNVNEVLLQGTIVEYLDEVSNENGTWYMIKYHDQIGYVWKSYVELLLDGSVELTYNSGTKKVFRSLGNGTYAAPEDVHDTLEKIGDRYFLTRMDQTKYIYLSDGKLKEIRDKYDNIIHVEYKDGRIDFVRDPFLREFVFEYNDANGMIKSITAPDGRKVQYTYDKDLNLIQVINPENELTSFTYYTDYTDSGEFVYSKIKSITDGNGHQVIRNEYDEFGRMIKQYDANSHVQYHIYQDIFLTPAGETWGENDIQLARYYIDENGNVSKTEFDIASKRPIKEIDAYGRESSYQYQYSETGFIEVQFDKYNNKTIYEYDNRYNLVNITDNNNDTIHMEYDDKNNLTDVYDKLNQHTQYIYEPYKDNEQDENEEIKLRLQKVIDPELNETEYTYYNFQEPTSVEGIIVHLRGLVKTVTEHRRNKDGQLVENFNTATYKYEHGYNNKTHIIDNNNNTTSFYYDTYGRIVEEKDAKGHSIYYAYDLMNRLISHTDHLGNTTYYSYDDVGNKLSVTDKRKFTTNYQYDKKNQLTKVTDPMDYSVSYKYDPKGNLIEKTNQKGGKTTRAYDALNRLIKVTDPVGNTTFYAYDVDENMKPNSLGFHNMQTIDAAEHVFITEYDYLNRKSAEKQILTQPYYETGLTEIKTTFSYYKNDKLEKVIDPQGKITKYDYDKLGRTKSVTDALELGGVLEISTSTEYDVVTTDEGKRSVVTTCVNSMDKPASIVYNNELGHKVKEVDAEAYETIYEYDEVGNVVKMIDAGKNLTSYEYDELNRLEKVIDAKLNEIKYDYDENGNKIIEFDKKGCPTIYQYDKNNRLERVNITSDLLTKTVYTYDELGNVKTEMDANNNTKAYTYDKAGRLYMEIDACGNARYYEYDTIGREKFTSGWINRYIGTTTRYDDLGRIESVIDPLGNTVHNTYDAVGNLKTKTDANGNLYSYEYDIRGRMAVEIQPGDVTIPQNRIDYEYDVLGRLKKKWDSYGTVTEFDYDNLDQLKKTTIRNTDGTDIITTAQTYNGIGQIETETDGETYVKTNGTGITTRYLYNELNLLKKKTTYNKKTEYFYDENGNLETETDWRGNTYTYRYGENYDSFDYNKLLSKADPFGKTIETLTYYENGAQRESIDALNNKTSFYYDGNNRLIETADPEDNKTKTSYDANGNIISTTDGNGNTTEYDYDFAGRLIFVCNALNELTAYTYDNNGNMLTQTDGKGNTLRAPLKTSNFL